MHTRGWVAEVSRKPAWPRAAARTGQGCTTPPSEVNSSSAGLQRCSW